MSVSQIAATACGMCDIDIRPVSYLKRIRKKDFEIRNQFEKCNQFMFTHACIVDNYYRSL